MKTNNKHLLNCWICTAIQDKSISEKEPKMTFNQNRSIIDYFYYAIILLVTTACAESVEKDMLIGKYALNQRADTIEIKIDGT